MKFMPIVYPSQASAQVLSIGSHFALGQHVAGNMAYHHLFLKAHSWGSFVMVDNGAAEKDEDRVDFETIYESCKDFADEFVMPDVLKDGAETFSLTGRYLHLVPARQRAICPQGSTWSEWSTWLDAMVNAFPCATICIPKHLETLPGGRANALDMIEDRGLQYRYYIHLLGIWGDPYEEIRAVCRPYVRSIDSGIAMAYSLKGASLTMSSKHYALHNMPLPSHLHAKYIDNVATITGWCQCIQS